MVKARNALCACVNLTLVCAIAMGVGIAHAASVDSPASSGRLFLTRLAQPGPWSGISQLIIYRRRLWFVNSVPFQNFNAADVYSLHLETGGVRYEHHLFSQDAGQPTVFAGKLYWPFEDSRASAGRGEFMVTDGERWRWRAINATRSFHSHSMLACGDRLLSGSGAWSGGIQMSRDGGMSWTQSYVHDTAKGKVSRVITLAHYAGDCYAGVRAYNQPGPKLLQWRDQQVTGVPGSEEIERLDSLTTGGAALFGVASGDSGQRLMRYDGQSVQYLDPPAGHALQALSNGKDARGNDALHAVSSSADGGALWRLDDRNRWHQLWQVQGEMPVAVTLCGTRVFIGTVVDGGAGALWGSNGSGCTNDEPPAAPPALDARVFNASQTPDASVVASHLAMLDESLASPAGYERRALAIRERLEVLIALGGEAVGNALSTRLNAAFPSIGVKTFASHELLPASALARHYLLRAIGLIGRGRVPPELLLLPWIHADNSSQKYFDPIPVALWTVGVLAQSDDGTVAALMQRLARASDPPWLQADVIGALNALGKERFGHDRAAWRNWWATHQMRPS